MDAMRYAELRTSIDCGELDCLKGCCDRLATIQAALRNLNPRDLVLLQKMLCGCTVSGSENPNPTGNACFDALVGFVKEHDSTINALQTALIVLGGTDIPIVDQTIAVMQLVLEQFEDAAQAKPGDPTTMDSTVKTICGALVSMDNWRKGILSNLPDALKGVLDLVTGLLTSAASLATCCSLSATTPPALPPAPTSTPVTPNTPTNTPGQVASCGQPIDIEQTPIQTA